MAHSNHNNLKKFNKDLFAKVWAWYRETPEHRTPAALQLLRETDDLPAGCEMQQALDAIDTHLLRVDQASQALEPLDVASAVIPLPVPPGGLHQALGFVQAKGLFRR